MKRFLFCTACTIFLALSSRSAAQSPEFSPSSKENSASAEKILIRDIANAGKLNAYLYRGTQPNENGLKELKKLGVTMIVDLRGEFRHESDNEKTCAEELGMKSILIPGDGWSPPTDRQLAEFFAVVAQRPRETIFVHCWHGADRTGTFLAAYRIAFEHWTPEQAIAETREFHFSSFWHPAMKDYIRNFPQRLAASETLAPYRSLPPFSVISPAP